MQFKRPESVLVVVHTVTEVLLIKRADHENFWQSVTGSLEWGEGADSAAKRELAEETGIISETLRKTGISRSYAILDQWQHRYPSGTLRNSESLFYCFLPNKPDITLDPLEHTAVVWLGFAEAADKVFSWSNKVAIRSLI